MPRRLNLLDERDWLIYCFELAHRMIEGNDVVNDIRYANEYDADTARRTSAEMKADRELRKRTRGSYVPAH